ncbi:unnamed protein product, partial [Musa acuminata subsp. burmannicoides]
SDSGEWSTRDPFGQLGVYNNPKSQLYQMKIWQGDPCAPQQFIWSGVNCTYSSSGTPRVTSLTLSYHGLNGAIPNVSKFIVRGCWL